MKKYRSNIMMLNNSRYGLPPEFLQKQVIKISQKH